MRSVRRKTFCVLDATVFWIFSGYESAMNNTTKPLLLSLKPRYADLIFAGRKKAELRRRIASGIEGRDVFRIYILKGREINGDFSLSGSCTS